MFSFWGMAGDYENRKIERFEEEGLVIDTCLVTDGEHLYETGVCHSSYNSGDWVIVEAYDTKEDAKEGHKKWIEIMTSDNLPEYLDDCMNAQVSHLGGKTSMRFIKKLKH